MCTFLTVGLGGGGFMTIFDKKSGQAEVIDFRETTSSGINTEDLIIPQNKSNNVDIRLFDGKDTIYLMLTGHVA